MDRLELGGVLFRPLDAGTMRLDGGACFGAIPKTIWSGFAAADENNLVPLALRPLLVHAGGKTILVDAGLGDAVDERLRALYAYDGGDDEARFVERAGVDPGEIDLVLFTHLHADHMAGAFRRANGGIVPRFPRARYVVQRGEWEDATRPTPLTRPGYVPGFLAALEATGRLETVEGEGEIAPGVRVVVTGGHTRRHQAVLFETGEGPAVAPGDVCPMRAHLRPGWISALDLDRPATFAAKERLLRNAAEGAGALFLYHETGAPAGRVTETATGRFEWAPASPAENAK